ncbi:MAG: hypothetical protein JOY80_03930 [Candidatus Dormibacteraeota bacterium]|nr:hypothetical protein [Candidatus Dormibacteraeota bacterium]
MSFVTTEHYTLQTARAATIAESTGRGTVYLTSVSSVTVALAFIGQVSNLGTPFFVFAFVLLPALFFVGVVTFERVLQTSKEDGLLAMRINRLRRFYVDFGPGLANYVAMPVPEDDPEAAMRQHGIRGGRWQTLLAMPGMIAVINSVLIGVLAGLAAGRFIPPHWASTVIGAGAFIVSAVAHNRRHARVFWAPEPAESSESADR